MKKTISMLFTCVLMITGCGPEEVTPAPTPAPTCQKLKGTYLTTLKLTSAANDPALCEGFAAGDVTQGETVIDSSGNMRVEGYLCTTTYAANDCDVRADCVAAGESWSSRYVVVAKVNASGAEFAGTVEITGSGLMCPRMAGTITGLR